MKNEVLFNPFYIAIPIVLGLSVIGYLFWKEFDPSLFETLRPTARMWTGILLAVFFMLCQNFALTQRFKVLVGHKLSWKQAFRVNMLCEFTSAATPSAVGGSSLIAVYLHQEGLSGGEGTSIMIANLFLDELFLSLACILVLLLVPTGILFPVSVPLDAGFQ
ncbi:MAG: flippase-like domain-containing protein, partial [Candidatus Paraprevotella stercoravium]|nr:flippase-like domain-containing protein [Candidatus Paraprevotella stercoravium]